MTGNEIHPKRIRVWLCINYKTNAFYSRPPDCISSDATGEISRLWKANRQLRILTEARRGWYRKLICLFADYCQTFASKALSTAARVLSLACAGLASSSCAVNAPALEWSRGVVPGGVDEVVSVEGIALTPESDLLCAFFESWLTRRSLQLMSCNLKEIKPTSDYRRIFAFKGEILPKWMNGEPGDSLYSEGNVSVGRRKLKVVWIEYPQGRFGIIL